MTIDLEDEWDGEDEVALAPPRSELAETASRLEAILEQETALARIGELTVFAEIVREKRTAAAEFMAAKTRLENGGEIPTDDECAALRSLLTTADENALVLQAVRSTIDDMASRLRKVLTASADPGTYGPPERRVRYAVAARFDTKI